MKKRTKYLQGIIMSFVLLCMLQINQIDVLAAPSLSASASTSDLKKDDYVEVQVSLTENPSISTLGASLSYDSSVLKYDSSTWNSGFSGSDMQMASDTGSEVNLSVVCDDSYSSDGTVVTVRFQAVEDASSIPVTLSLRDMADADLAQITDCIVASAVHTPQAQKTTPTSEDTDTADTDTVDLENLDDSSDIRIVDEKSVPEQQSEDIVTDVTGGTERESNASSGMSQGVSVSNTSSSTQTSTTPQTKASRPDSNYKTGIGFGSDALLIGAAAFGILALVLAVRRHKEEK